MLRVLIVTLSLLAPGFAAAAENLEENKKLVTEFYQQVLFKGDYTAINRYVAPGYIQHNPNVADGREALRDLVKSFSPDPGNAEPFGEIVRVVAEGDLVVLHIRNYTWPGPNGGAVVDIFRVEDGMIAEHWDVIQAVPEKSANDNGMF